MSRSPSDHSERETTPTSASPDLDAERAVDQVLPQVTTDAFESALAVSEQRRLLAIEAAGVADWTFDVARGLLVCSPLARALHGVARDEPVTIALHDARIHPADRAAVRAIRAAAMDPAGTGHYRAEFRFYAPGGEERWIESVGQAIFADTPQGRRATHVLGAMRDVTADAVARHEVERLLLDSERARTDARSAQESAETARHEADLANQAKSAFLATMSHELRTPLNAMVGYTQLLELGLAGPLTTQQREYLERLTHSSQHLLALVNDILDLSKIEAGEMDIESRDATTGPSVSAAIELMRPLASSKRLQLVDTRPDDEGVPYVGDEDRVRQIVLNLLSNAVKFTPPGGTVTVSCDTVGETPTEDTQLEGAGPWANVRVSDTGIGIALEEQGRIFEPFHQIENERTRTQGGTGLGLAISHRLARLMGGDLTVESTPGAGATFTLWLPSAQRADGLQVEMAADRTMRAERAAAILQTPGLGLIGTRLREHVDDVLSAYTDRLRNDPAIPLARDMRVAHLEDHSASFLADLAQSLVIVDDAGRDATMLLRDGSAIHRVIADSHGARRFAQGWDEGAVRRDLQLLREEVERAVRQSPEPTGAAERTEDVEAAVRVLMGLIARAEAVSMRAWRRAAAAAAAGGQS